MMSKTSPDCWYTELTKKNIRLNSEAIFYNNIAICCYNFIAMVLNLLANGFVAYRYYQTRTRQPVSNTLLFILALVHILQGIIAQPVFISMRILEIYGIFHCTLQRAADAILSVLLGYGFFMATIILTSERNFAILYPFRHRVYMTKKVLSYLSLTIFGVWTLFATICYITFPRLTELNYIYLFIMSFGLIYTLAVYVNIFRESRKLTARHNERVKSRCPTQNGLADKIRNGSRFSVDTQNEGASGTKTVQTSGKYAMKKLQCR